ncbi:MAG: LPS export ABC transporter periplasmic protein LptC [Gemmatimonadota bacterium]|nr:LPS export ABC transporter periplasmic protein LptC [Gemmatimonadota bacterium]
MSDSKNIRGFGMGVSFRFCAGTSILLFLLVAAGCRSGQPGAGTEAAGGETVDMPDQVFEGFDITITENGIKKGWVQAERAEKYEARKVFLATRPRVVFYSASGAVQSTMISLRGLIDIATGDMEAFDSVVVTSADSSKVLETRHLVWKKTENIIIGDSAVVIRARGRGVVYGDGIRTDAGFDNVELRNPTGDINVLGETF